MKRIFLNLWIPALVFVWLWGSSFRPVQQPVSPYVSGQSFEIPEQVQTIIQHACYGCHHTASKNLKGKKKLDFDKLAGLKTYKLAGKMQDIVDVLKKGKMPPKKFLAKYPDKALKQAEKEQMLSWARATIQKLSH